MLSIAYELEAHFLSGLHAGQRPRRRGGVAGGRPIDGNDPVADLHAAPGSGAAGGEGAHLGAGKGILQSGSKKSLRLCEPRRGGCECQHEEQRGARSSHGVDPSCWFLSWPAHHDKPLIVVSIHSCTSALSSRTSRPAAGTGLPMTTRMVPCF